MSAIFTLPKLPYGAYGFAGRLAAALPAAKEPDFVLDPWGDLGSVWIRCRTIGLFGPMWYWAIASSMARSAIVTRALSPQAASPILQLTKPSNSG